jgi:di/tricarboxylate transporter
MLTVIDTSTTVLDSSISEELGYGAFGLFQFSLLGLSTETVGLLYLAFVAPHWLPQRQTPASEFLNPFAFMFNVMFAASA